MFWVLYYLRFYVSSRDLECFPADKGGHLHFEVSLLFHLVVTVGGVLLVGMLLKENVSVKTSF